MSAVNQHRVRAGYGLVLLILSYEWLVSGFDKLLSGKFVVGLHEQMMEQLHNIQFGFYASFLQAVCMPHCATLAALIEVAEVMVGTAFAVSGLLLLFGKRVDVAMRVSAISALIGFIMSVNFFLYQGGNLFIDTSDPFDEGISIDLLMSLIQLCIAVVGWPSMTWIGRKEHVFLHAKGGERR